LQIATAPTEQLIQSDKSKPISFAEYIKSLPNYQEILDKTMSCQFGNAAPFPCTNGICGIALTNPGQVCVTCNGGPDDGASSCGGTNSSPLVQWYDLLYNYVQLNPQSKVQFSFNPSLFDHNNEQFEEKFLTVLLDSIQNRIAVNPTDSLIFYIQAN
jgi:hypothetical protein